MSRKEIEYIINNLMFEDTSISDKEDQGSKIINRLKKALKPIKVQSGKKKGRNLQKWVCQKIAELFRIEYNQQDDYCQIHSREMGQSGVDIIIRGDIKEFFPFAIECKSSEQLNLLKTIQQAKKNTRDNEWWVIVYKSKSMRNPVVIMDWDCFYFLSEDVLKGME